MDSGNTPSVIGEPSLPARTSFSLGFEPTPDELSAHVAILDPTVDVEAYPPADVIEAWLLKLMAANHESKTYDVCSFDRVILDVWLTACRKSERGKAGKLMRFGKSPILRQTALSPATLATTVGEVLTSVFRTT